MWRRCTTFATLPSLQRGNGLVRSCFSSLPVHSTRSSLFTPLGINVTAHISEPCATIVGTGERGVTNEIHSSKVRKRKDKNRNNRARHHFLNRIKKELTKGERRNQQLEKEWGKAIVQHNVTH